MFHVPGARRNSSWARDRFESFVFEPARGHPEMRDEPFALELGHLRGGGCRDRQKQRTDGKGSHDGHLPMIQRTVRDDSTPVTPLAPENRRRHEIRRVGPLIYDLASAVGLWAIVAAVPRSSR